LALDRTSTLLISEFYPCALRSDEYFVISNVGSGSVNLRNWTVTDGEGAILFVSDLAVPSNGRVSVSENASSFRCAFGRDPEVSLANRSAVSCSGSFRLADGGDAVWLMRPDGSLSDFVVYGDADTDSTGWMGQSVPRIKQGEVAKRVLHGSTMLDTNGSVDWCPFREYRYGFTDIPSFSTRVAGGSVVAFVSPDCSLDTILSGIVSAKSSLKICTYEIASVPVCRALLDAYSRGVAVRLLVDGAPAGGLKGDEVACLSVLASVGISVVTINGNLSERCVQHIGALHAKYMVVDGLKSFVLSENFVDSGLPSDPLFGNRGWGIEVVDASLAAHLSQVFDSDSRSDRPDVVEWWMDHRNNRSAVLPVAPKLGQHEPEFMPLVTMNEVWVQAIVSPDASVNAPYLASLIAHSSDVLISQFQADTTWNFRWTGAETSPLVDSAISAMRGGASVRGLFDSSWYNLDGNKRIVDLLSGVARNESLDGVFAQLNTRSPAAILHNKGVILNEKTTLISSNNWCFASFARNRELALLVESTEVAAFFRRVFETDWVPDTTAPVADAGFDRTVSPGGEVVLDARGSEDDRAIADWSWDLGGDGSTDCADAVYELTFDRPGRYRVVLIVTDAWGNEDSDTVYIDVADASSVRAPMQRERYVWWLPMASGVLGTLAGILIARKRVHAHKINH